MYKLTIQQPNHIKPYNLGKSSRKVRSRRRHLTWNLSSPAETTADPDGIILKCFNLQWTIQTKASEGNTHDIHLSRTSQTPRLVIFSVSLGIIWWVFPRSGLVISCYNSGNHHMILTPKHISFETHTHRVSMGNLCGTPGDTNTPPGPPPTKPSSPGLYFPLPFYIYIYVCI